MLTGRTIVITGAARGLGREIALGCAAAGAELVLADIDTAGAEVTAELVTGNDGRASVHAVDLRDPASITGFRDALAGRRIHGLVNNGAIATGIGGKAHDQIDIETWDAVMEVNVRGTWLMIRALAPSLAATGSGRIVNIASDTALWGAPNLLSYVASKGAVLAMTRSLARELGPDRTGITVVAPGILTTESTDYVPAERHAHYESGRAVKGPQPPEDVVGTIVFLLTEPALTLTGQTLPVNRGFVFA